MLRLLIAALCSAIAFATITAPSPAIAQSDAEFEQAECPMNVPHGQEDHIECGYVEVPEDRSDSGGRTIRLAVAVLRSTATSPEPDPVLYLSGGPGGPSLAGEMQSFNFENAAFAQSTRDLVFYDQRGTGFSQPLHCEELLTPIEQLRDNLTPRESEAAYNDGLRACAARHRADGVDFEQYSSAVSALDIVDVMTALGYDEWNLYGVSYGTRLALTAMRDTPEHIRSVILDSVLPPQVPSEAETARNFERALYALLDGCASDPACGTAFPNLEQDYWDLIARANAEPIVVTVNDENDQPVDLHISGHAILSGTFTALYVTELIPSLPFAGNEIAHGNKAILQLLAQQLVFAFSDTARAMSTAVRCNDDTWLLEEADIEEATAGVRQEILDARIGLVDDQALEESHAVCEAFGAEPPAAFEDEPVESDIPALVLAGAYDPITPPSWSMLAADSLGNSQYFEFARTGHGPSFDWTCASDLMSGFVSEPEATLDGSCVGEIELTPFQVPPMAPAPAPTPPPSGVITAPNTGTGDAHRDGRPYVLLAASAAMAALGIGFTVRGRPRRVR